MFKRIILSLFLLLVFSNISQADVAPDPGEMRVYPQLVFDLQEDFSDYRFFLVSLIHVEEVEVEKGETKVIDGKNFYSAKRVVTLTAIPKSELEKLGIAQFVKSGDSASSETLLKLARNKENISFIKLLDHSFQEDITVSARANWSYPTYRIERDGNSLKAVKTGEITPKLSVEEEKEINSGKFWLITVIVGIMFASTIMVIGIWLFRKVMKKG